MIYGLYRSAAGVMTSGYRQGVIANNLANVDTVGFKRNLAVTQQRRLGVEERPELMRFQDRFFDALGGGTLLSPTETDHSQGNLETTGKGTDAAIVGEGYFVVEKQGERFLTRNGNFVLNNQGELILADGSNAAVLSSGLSRIVLDPLAKTEINEQGGIIQRGLPVAQLAVKRADRDSLEQIGQHLLRPDGGVDGLADSTTSTIQGGALERSNVEPSTELTQLLESQRMLEANANLIRYQDQTLGRLVNDVGRVT
jgi:flagellar basal body rod protein FlgG